MPGSGQWFAALLALLSGPALGTPCAPVIESVAAALGAPLSDVATAPSGPPADGWQPVTLPDDWSRRWPGHDGTVWYRLQWRSDCGAAEPTALVVESINNAGEVYVNDELIWRDASLVAPMSRSWNLPRHWVLPRSALVPDTNTLWFRLQGHAMESPGLGRVHLLPQSQAHALTGSLQFQRRTMIAVSLAMSLIVGSLFAAMWLFYRRTALHGWFALTSLAWACFVWNVLATSTWPFPDTGTLVRANTVAFVAYVACFRMFMQRLLRPVPPAHDYQARLLTLASAAGVAALLLAPPSMLDATRTGVASTAAILFVATCLEFIARTLSTPSRAHVLLAGLLTVFLGAAVHDLLALHRTIDSNIAYAPWAGLILTLAIAAVLAIRIARNMRRVERFNDELAAAVDTACAELGTALRHEHELAVTNSRLKERLRMSYDLHDGLGSALGRAIVLAEQGVTRPEAGDTAHHLSTLRELRDELRQVIDAGELPSAGTAQTPIEWAAPTRHRFSTLFDELGIHSHWQLAPGWHMPPSARQCLGLTRLLEEALTNVVKHSGAGSVTVTLRLSDANADALELCIDDDGIGFDVERTRASGPGIGLRSMQARADSIGARLDIASRPGCTRICLHLRPHAATV